MTRARACAVIPVWGEAMHLGELVASLKAQTEPVDILAVSSNCAPETEQLLVDAEIPLSIHQAAGIGNDWNHALAVSSADYCFIAHQDDRYHQDYVGQLASLLDNHDGASIAWCDYHVDSNTNTLMSRSLPALKRAMNEVFGGGRTVLESSRARRWINAVGPVIACPTVMYNRREIEGFEFSADFEVNLDWDAWFRLANLSGPFVRTRRKLVTIRVHDGAESCAAKRSGVRDREDRQMLSRYWPSAAVSPVHSLLKRAY